MKKIFSRNGYENNFMFFRIFFSETHLRLINFKIKYKVFFTKGISNSYTKTVHLAFIKT